MECQAIEFSVGADEVATITLNRPHALNAFDDQMAAEISRAWESIRERDDVRSVVLQANGDRAFSTGVDIKGGGHWFMRANIWNSFDPGETLAPKTHHHVWKPVVCAVHGLCAGGAQYFLNESDIIICSDDSEFFDPHADAGIVSALEPIGMVARGVPIGDVLRWALMGSGERITAQTALRLGLVTEVVARSELRRRAHEIAASIAARDPAAVQGTVRAIWESLDMARSTAIRNGMSYTHIGNRASAGPPPRDPGADGPQYR